MDDERKTYFDGMRKSFAFQANITPTMKYMDALVAESVARMYGEPYPCIEDL